MTANEYGKYVDFEHSIKIEVLECHFCRKPINKFPFVIIKERKKENPYYIIDKYAHGDCFENAKKLDGDK